MVEKRNDFPGITLVGLGPGDPDLLTRQAWRLLEDISEIYLRTRQHPVVSGLPPHLEIHAFDEQYQGVQDFAGFSEQIVERVLDLGRREEGVVYAVPGHPFIAEATGAEIVRRARQADIPVRVLDGISFLEPTFSALGLDPLPQTVMVDALDLAAAHVPSFPPHVPAIIVQIYSEQVAAQVKLTLRSRYPDAHPVRLVHAAGTGQVSVENLALFEIDHSANIGPLTTLYVPPLGPATSLEEFMEVIAHLRAPDGCPWDRQQTHQSLRPYLLEEAYEVISALDAGDPRAMEEEFGDLLLQVVLHAQIGAENGVFTMADILRGITTKIVRRHPHVFGAEDIADTQGVLVNWERLKAEERAEKGKAEAGLLDSVALALPALVQAEQYQKRAARVGFDWPDMQGVLDKVDEELREVSEASDGAEKMAELGDLLFAVVNLARWYDVEPESALREANQRFRRRFFYIEQSARRQGRDIAGLSLDEMEALWQEAKRSQSSGG